MHWQDTGKEGRSPSDTLTSGVVVLFFFLIWKSQQQALLKGGSLYNQHSFSFSSELPEQAKTLPRDSPPAQVNPPQKGPRFGVVSPLKAPPSGPPPPRPLPTGGPAPPAAASPPPAARQAGPAAAPLPESGRRSAGRAADGAGGASRRRQCGRGLRRLRRPGCGAWPVLRCRRGAQPCGAATGRPGGC